MVGDKKAYNWSMKFGGLRKKVMASLQVLTVFAVLLAPSMGAAQNRSQKSVITQLLWQTILGCYTAPVERVTEDDTVILRVELNNQGDISNLPTIISPEKLSKGERALLREATVALITCTPIISGGGDKTIYGTFDIVTNQEGLSLANVDASVGALDVVVEPDEPVVEEDTTEDTTEDSDQAIGTEITEGILDLTKSDRSAIQRRLTLLGYDTKGIDGAFGPGTRKAIISWQTDNDFPGSGYFDANQMAALYEMSEEEYAEWESSPKSYVDRNGCLRTASGTIVKGRSFKCDMSAASQSMGISR